MKLLIRDTQINPKRMLTWVLVIRDYLNIAKWAMERTGFKVAKGSKEHVLLCAAVATYFKYFGEGNSRYDAIVRPMQQEALKYLGMNGLPFENEPFPPIEIAVALSGNVGPLHEKNIRSETMWFVNHEQAMLHLLKKSGSLMRQLKLAPADAYVPETTENDVVKWSEYDPQELLSWGVNTMPERMAL